MWAQVNMLSESATYSYLQLVKNCSLSCIVQAHNNYFVLWKEKNGQRTNQQGHQYVGKVMGTDFYVNSTK